MELSYLPCITEVMAEQDLGGINANVLFVFLFLGMLLLTERDENSFLDFKLCLVSVLVILQCIFCKIWNKFSKICYFLAYIGEKKMH